VLDHAGCVIGEVLLGVSKCSRPCCVCYWWGSFRCWHLSTLDHAGCIIGAVLLGALSHAGCVACVSTISKPYLLLSATTSSAEAPLPPSIVHTECVRPYNNPNWPPSPPSRGQKCVGPYNYVRHQSLCYFWFCLTVRDAGTSQDADERFQFSQKSSKGGGTGGSQVCVCMCVCECVCEYVCVRA
jgi:hypothetical protein